MQLRRLVIAESARFPELGHAFYQQGPGRTITALAATFERLAARGLLAVDDADLAASQFNWLVMSGPLNRGDAARPRPHDNQRELERHADDGVRTFLAAYGTRKGRAAKAAR